MTPCLQTIVTEAGSIIVLSHIHLHVQTLEAPVHAPDSRMCC